MRAKGVPMTNWFDSIFPDDLSQRAIFIGRENRLRKNEPENSAASPLTLTSTVMKPHRVKPADCRKCDAGFLQRKSFLQAGQFLHTRERRRLGARTRHMSSAFRGVVAHGAGFSKHFAAFTLLGKDGVTYVDCALAGKDGWDVDVLRELCIALALPTQTTAVENALDTMTLHESSSKDSPAHVVVEVDILRCTYETIETHRPNGDEKFCETGGTRSSAHRCAHPLELRTRRQPSPNSTQDSGPWRTWRAVPKPEDDGKKTTEKPKHKDTRASCFAASLVKHFSLDGLKKGTGVIDVAGGSGDLSHELFYRYGIRCSIIDPRGEGVKVTSRRARLFKSRGENVSMIPETWRAVSPLATSLQDKWSTPDGKVAHIKLLFDVNLMHDPVTKNLLEEASAIVGLHPDQGAYCISPNPADCLPNKTDTFL